MGSSRALLCSTTAFVLFLLSAALEDEHFLEQREVTFDLDDIMQERQRADDSFMMQKELDLMDLFDAGESPMQVVVPPKHKFDISRRPAMSPRFLGPRSRGGPPALDYPVQFPLGRPTADNVQAICVHAARRPLYPPSYFPSSGFGQLRRMAAAVNKAESWFNSCCTWNQTWGGEMTLCCATQAWELSVKSFCEENSAVKDRQHDCCKHRGIDRLNCFHGEAPNPSYGPTEELPVPPLSSNSHFAFDRNACHSTVAALSGIRAERRRNVDLKFPPGRPTADTIESLCGNQKLRPLYSVKCLRGPGYEEVALQATTVNRMEKRFKQCCKKKQEKKLDCAEQTWREELDRFCSAGMDSLCCPSSDAGESDQYFCFQGLSPDPHYNQTSSATEELSLAKVCDTHKIIKRNKSPVGFPLKKLVHQCCPLADEEKTVCLSQRLEEMSEKLCSGNSFPVAVRRCCHGSSPEDAPQCISDLLMDAITKATKVSRQKKKKRCPLS